MMMRCAHSWLQLLYQNIQLAASACVFAGRRARLHIGFLRSTTGGLAFMALLTGINGPRCDNGRSRRLHQLTHGLCRQSSQVRQRDSWRAIDLHALVSRVKSQFRIVAVKKNLSFPCLVRWSQ